MLEKYNLQENEWLSRLFSVKEKWALRLVDDRCYKELEADFKEKHTKAALSFCVNILMDAAKVYTLAVFKWFEAELFKGYDSTFKLSIDIGTVRIYEVTNNRKSFPHIVTFDSSDKSITCNCKKYEFAGILCSHALKILSSNDVMTVPSQYILKKWRKDIKDQARKVSHKNVNDDNDLKGKIARR
ncbi:FAR1-related sequence 1 [Euphorbia peplus]|nr:FAR1-related sequence 1 [Euphorbia peplus]